MGSSTRVVQPERRLVRAEFKAGAVRLVAARGMLASMRGRSDCYIHAASERFFATLECDLAMTRDWHTRDEARSSGTSKRGTTGSDRTRPWSTTVRRSTQRRC